MARSPLAGGGEDVACFVVPLLQLPSCLYDVNRRRFGKKFARFGK
jgi:hypothetical protein